MSKLHALVFAILVVLTGTLVSLNGCGGGGVVSPIGHVVVIFQENRTPDNLFQDPILIGRGADIAQSGIDSKGSYIPLHKTKLNVNYDPSHTHEAFEQMCDLNKMTGQCQMDGADLIASGCLGAPDCLGPNMSFGYVDPNEVQPYFQLAEQYTFADRMFQTNQGPSMPAHQFILSGTSAPTAKSHLFAAENPSTNPYNGCDAPAQAIVWLIDPSGNEHSNTPIYPCFEHKTLTDLLEERSLTWRYYAPSSPAIWNAPEAIHHICGPQTGSDGTTCQGPDWTNHVILNQKQILSDITDSHLQNVSWIIPSGQASDHPAATNGSGPSWVASIVNAIGNSPYWANTAIFITWDDWGGWYDHVPPPQVRANCVQWGCGYIYGFRVPLIVISPYAKASYISHTRHDFGSILKFIENTFGLPSLGYADAAADNLSDCFDYSQIPLTFQTITAPLNAQYFLNDKTPPADPDDD